MKIEEEYKWALVLAFVAAGIALWIISCYRISTGIIYISFLIITMFCYVYWRAIIGKKRGK